MARPSSAGVFKAVSGGADSLRALKVDGPLSVADENG